MSRYGRFQASAMATRWSWWNHGFFAGQAVRLLQDAVPGLTSLASLNGRQLTHGDSAGRRRAMCVLSTKPPLHPGPLPPTNSDPPHTYLFSFIFHLFVLPLQVSSFRVFRVHAH